MNKPEIIIGSGSQSAIQPLLYGIEEEEIPFRIAEEVTGTTTIQKAYNCALASQLSVGVAYDDQFAYLHYKNLPEEQPLFKVSMQNKEQLSCLGANAARLVKGVPFKEIT